MKNLLRKISQPLPSAAILCLLSLSFLPRSAHAQLVLIANSNIGQSEFSRTALRDVFTGALSNLEGNASVTPVLLKDGEVHEAMLALLVGKSDGAFRATWRGLLFSGQGTMPRTMESEAAAVEYVAHTPGAIGYIGIATPHRNVKVLTVK